MRNQKTIASETVLTGSVGFKGHNHRQDAKLVQLLLNDWLGHCRQTLLKVDGLVGPLTIGAIKEFQSQNRLESDGRVDPDGPSLAQLVAMHIAGVDRGLVQSEFLKTAARVSPAASPLSAVDLGEHIRTYLVGLRKNL